MGFRVRRCVIIRVKSRVSRLSPLITGVIPNLRFQGAKMGVK